MIYILGDKSICDSVQSMAVWLPCSLQNFKFVNYKKEEFRQILYIAMGRLSAHNVMSALKGNERFHIMQQFYVTSFGQQKSIEIINRQRNIMENHK